MTTAASCNLKVLHLAGKALPLRPWGQEPGWTTATSRCSDCGVQPGGYHHLGCDIQSCPACGGQLFSCGCPFDETGPHDDPDDDGLYDDGPDDELSGTWVTEDVFVDAGGYPAERVRIGGLPVTVRYGDLPEKDCTVVNGIPCTTALRTVIDLAAEEPENEVVEMIRHCLNRGMFTVAEARQRIAEPDLRHHRGAEVLRRLLPRL